MFCTVYRSPDKRQRCLWSVRLDVNIKYNYWTCCCSDEAERHRHSAEPDRKKHLWLPGENLRSDHRKEVGHTCKPKHLEQFNNISHLLKLLKCLFPQFEEQSLGEWIQVRLFLHHYWLIKLCREVFWSTCSVCRYGGFSLGARSTQVLPPANEIDDAIERVRKIFELQKVSFTADNVW